MIFTIEMPQGWLEDPSDSCIGMSCIHQTTVRDRNREGSQQKKRGAEIRLELLHFYETELKEIYIVSLK